MTDINKRIEGFVRLGDVLSRFIARNKPGNEDIPDKNPFFKKLDHALNVAAQSNGWFTPENMIYALTQWSVLLKEDNIKSWLCSYAMENRSPKKVAVIMAGNIPLVGFHDFLSVLLTGHEIVVKLSSNDKYLLPAFAAYLEDTVPYFKGKIQFTEARLNDFDAAIATGSNNTARYFEYYLGKKPNIIRKNRNSVAVLNGNESTEQLEALGKDIFTYYGLGCRSVSKLFVPEGYDFKLFFEAIYPYHSIIDHKKYANNYDYNKAVYLMSLFNILENGFLMLKEDTGYASPIATVFYEYYKDPGALKMRLKADEEHIQCIAANSFSDNEIPFGKTQQPQLWDYADRVDTVDFLLNLTKYLQ